MRFMLSLIPACCLLLLASLTFGVTHANDKMMTGGWSPMTEADKADPSFQQVLAAATVAYNAKYSADGSNRAPASVAKVGEASKQVVSGMKYKFTVDMAVCDDCEATSCQFTVWYQVWMPNPTKVLSMDC